MHYAKITKLKQGYHIEVTISPPPHDPNEPVVEILQGDDEEETTRKAYLYVMGLPTEMETP